MCTYQTERLSLRGSAKGAQGWFALTDASVYFDHPSHARAEHTLNLDFLNPSRGPRARVALELDAASALALADAIRAALAHDGSTSDDLPRAPVAATEPG